VGNITLGGTGKTVLVESIARYLKQKGHKVAILSRGYGKGQNGKRLPVRQAGKAQSEYQNMGDEPFMLQQNLKNIPVLVDTNRIRSAKLAMRQYNVDTVILDDGLQQWRIKKDLDIVTIDAFAGLGNRHMLPRGILRQPLSGLKKVGVFVLTNTDLNPDTRIIKDRLLGLNPSSLILESIHNPLGFYRIDKKEEFITSGLLKGKTVAVLCAIGNPTSFQNSISKLGINIGLTLEFPDHHRYSFNDIEKIFQEVKQKNIDTLVVTEKDAVKLSTLDLASYRLNIFVLRIELKIVNNEQEFYNRLLRIYSA
jgi:tetraacyldisaccharide 4'-kinase